jgi:uracil phosphoribosyltransferase
MKNYNCNSNDLDPLVMKNRHELNYKLCEGIDDNLENKNIILIDEFVGSGKTMEYVCNYLLNDKKVNKLFLLTIGSKYGERNFNNIKLNFIENFKFSIIYPWGYDN